MHLSAISWAFASRFLDDDQGATAIEYALIAGLVFVAIVVAVGFLGTETVAIFNSVGSHVSAAAGS